MVVKLKACAVNLQFTVIILMSLLIKCIFLIFLRKSVRHRFEANLNESRPYKIFVVSWSLPLSGGLYCKLFYGRNCFCWHGERIQFMPRKLFLLSNFFIFIFIFFTKQNSWFNNVSASLSSSLSLPLSFSFSLWLWMSKTLL